jgi:hypothetical protein
LRRHGVGVARCTVKRLIAQPELTTPSDNLPMLVA